MSGWHKWCPIKALGYTNFSAKLCSQHSNSYFNCFNHFFLSKTFCIISSVKPPKITPLVFQVNCVHLFQSVLHQIQQPLLFFFCLFHTKYLSLAYLQKIVCYIKNKNTVILYLTDYCSIPSLILIILINICNSFLIIRSRKSLFSRYNLF